MREAEIAALSDEFFEPTFTHDSATVMLGTQTSEDDLGDKLVTYLRPDARSLARVELHAVAAPDGSGEAVIEDVVLVLRGSRVYSRATLEELFGPSRKVEGPPDDEGQPSFQLQFAFERSMRGLINLRWYADPGDPPAMGDANGPDEVRADEIQLHRVLFATPEETAPPPTTITSVRPPYTPSRPPLPPIDLDEAMDTGAWVGDIVWRMLRPDFTLDRAREVLMAERTSEGDGERVVMKPGDPRLELAMVTLEGDHVSQVRIDIPHTAPLVVAVAAVSDRLNAQPIEQPGEITFQFESTRSRGTVALVLSSLSTASGPIAIVNVIEVARGV